jgi:hypothetical protein
MSERVELEMTEEDLEILIRACKPVTYMVFGGSEPRGPQENANSAWAVLGSKMGFRHMTVLPIPGKSDRFFTAEKV